MRSYSLEKVLYDALLSDDILSNAYEMPGCQQCLLFHLLDCNYPFVFLSINVFVVKNSTRMMLSFFEKEDSCHI